MAGEQVCLQYMFIHDFIWKKHCEIRSLLSSLISNILNCFPQVASCFPEALDLHLICRVYVIIIVINIIKNSDCRSYVA